MADAVQRTVDIRVTSTGIEKATQSLNRLADAQDGVVVSIDRATKVRERSESTIDRLARRYDEEYRAQRQLEQAQKDLDRARAAGLGGTRAFQTALAGIERAHKANSSAANDNATAIGLNRIQMLESIHVAISFADQVIAGQSPLRALAVEGGRIAQIFSLGSGGAGATLRAFGGIAVSALTSPITAAVGLTAAIAGINFAAIRAESSLEKLGATSRQTGLTAEQIQGAKIVGAGAGLDEKGAIGAFSNASQQFQKFAQNEGAVKSALDKIDAGFLKVADGARTAGEFIDIIEQKIRALPRADGLNLAQSLFGEDAGRALFDSIQSRAASMQGLAEATGRAGDGLNQAAKAAEETQRQIDRAAALASDKLLGAFQALGDPVASIKLGWYSIVGSIAQSVTESQNLQAVMRGFLHPVDTVRQLVTGETSFVGRLISPEDAGIIQPETVGASRQQIAAAAAASKKGRRSSSGGASSADRFASIQKDLENEISLLRSVGDEHDKIALKIKIEAEQQKLGTKATQEQRDRVAELVTQLDAAQKAEKSATSQGEQFASAMKRAGDAAAQSLDSFANDLLRGESAGKALSNVLSQIESQAISLASKSVSAGLFGENGSGGLLSSAFSYGKSLLGFADGGIMTSGGALPPNRYAGGGIANSPQLALFGEGRRPEAYVPLPDGRSIPVAMKSPFPAAASPGSGPNIAIHNYAAGVEVTPQMTPQGVAFIIRSALDGYSKNLPSILSDIQKRNNRG